MAFELGTCVRMNARITQRQCDINRRGLEGRNRRSPCLSCEKCSGLVNVAAEALSTSMLTETKEVSPMASKKGTCPVCKREDVSMSGPKCPRCYSRIAAGQDPVTGQKPEKPIIRSTPTDEDKAAFINKPVKASELPAVEKPALPAMEKPAPQASAISAYHIDIVAALDEAWVAKRALFTEHLLAEDTQAGRLRLGFRMLANLAANGY